MPSVAYERVMKCPSLPTLPQVAIELIELTRKPDASMAAIAKLVKGDVGLAAKVLKTVNSSFFGLTKPCATIDRAIGFLGLSTIKSIVLGFSLVECTRGVKDGGGLDLNAYWRRALYAAAGTRAIVDVTKACDPDEAFTGALFQDMGMLASYTALGPEYAKLLADAPKDHALLGAIETKELGFTHAEVGADLAAKWKFQSQVIDCVRFHHDAENAPDAHRQLVKCVALGWMLAETVTAESSTQSMAQLYILMKEWFGQEEGELEVLLERTAKSARELAKVFEKDIGPPPNVSEILLEANQQLMEQQLQSHRETVELRENQNTLVEQSRTDALTKALNRKAFDQELVATYTACNGERKPMSALFVDADKFKSVNDTHGHQAGDAVLVELARRIGAAVGSDGHAYRYGGEEFAVLLPRISGDRAAVIAESVRKAIEQAPFDLKGVPGAPPTLKITVSVGVSSTDTTASAPTSAEHLIQQADQAVYAAKKGGRNCVRFFGRGEMLNASVAAPAAGIPIKPTTGASPRPRSVWIVEDDPLAAALLNATFRRVEGVEVKWFRGCKEVQAMAAKVGGGVGGVTVPSVIITDLRLADGSGFDVLKSIRANPRMCEVHLVAMSASTEKTDQASAIQAGADVFHNKQEIGQSIFDWVKKVLSLAPRLRQAA